MGREYYFGGYNEEDAPDAVFPFPFIAFPGDIHRRLFWPGQSFWPGSFYDAGRIPYRGVADLPFSYLHSGSFFHRKHRSCDPYPYALAHADAFYLYHCQG